MTPLLFHVDTINFILDFKNVLKETEKYKNLEILITKWVSQVKSIFNNFVRDFFGER